VKYCRFRSTALRRIFYVPSMRWESVCLRRGRDTVGSPSTNSTMQEKDFLNASVDKDGQEKARLCVDAFLAEADTHD
jgi:hypothetical protein